jgi:peptidoglycan hydrolase CwlO-like protein
VLLVAPVRADTQSQLNGAEARLRKLIARITDENRTVQALETQANAIAQQVDAVQSKLSDAQGKIVDLEQRIRQATDAITASQGLLDHRAWVAYENGPGSSLEFLLGSTSLADLTDRLEIVNHVAQTDSDLIARINDARNLAAARQASLQILEEHLQVIKTDLSAKQKALDDKLSSAQAVVNQLNSDRAAALKEVRRLKLQRQREIAAAIAGSGGHGGPSIGGVLKVCPVDQPHAYADDFGAPRIGHRHRGNDLSAPTGTPIRAPFDGNAVDSWDPGGGNDVYVYGSQGFVFNAHLSAYAATGPVSTGTIIGYVGQTGDATGPHDHFEWHPNVIPQHLWVSPYGYSLIDGAIDPFPYLNSVC